MDTFPPTAEERRHAESVLAELVPEDQWAVYEPVLTKARERDLRIAVGGGIAFSLYSGVLRNTKDIDIFIVPPDHEGYLDLMSQAGFGEYTEVPYDRTWSYRGVRKGFIMDVLWGMLNDRAPLDEDWVRRGWEVELRGVPIRLLPPEELIWTKLYIVHRDRCDWPDILILLGARGPHLDWSHLLMRLGEDAPVLGGALSLFRWLCPGRAAQFPDWLWERAGLAQVGGGAGPAVDRRRTALIRSGDWFPL